MTIFLILAPIFSAMIHTEIKSLREFCNLLRCDIAFMEQFLQNGFGVVENKEEGLTVSGNPEVLVIKHKLKKRGKSGGYRIVYHSKTYKHNNSLKILNTYLASIYEPDEAVHGFIKGKNIKTNAEVHLAKNSILSVDFENYFESISANAIVQALVGIGFQEQVAQWISSLTTLNGNLIQGFTTSPILANIVTKDLDSELKILCGNEVDYTRYADDLYFSSNGRLPELQALTSVIENFGFRLNTGKTKFMHRGTQQYVTGLTVFDDKIPRISKKVKRNIRLETHFISKFGYKKHIKNKLEKQGITPADPNFKNYRDNEILTTQKRLYGWLNFIHAIEPDFSSKYYHKLNKSKP